MYIIQPVKVWSVLFRDGAELLAFIVPRGYAARSNREVGRLQGDWGGAFRRVQVCQAAPKAETPASDKLPRLSILG